MNVFFGPYGWMQWMWLVTTGFLPFLFLFRWSRDQPRITRLLVTMTILGYLHNAASVIQLCHGLP